MARPSVAVYLIAKNEARHVAQVAETTKHADQVVLVDTGSTDDTFELAKTAGIDAHRAQLTPFRFDDARNISLALVDPKIDLAMMLDCDEVLRDGWREAIDAAYDPTVARYRYQLVNRGAGTWLSMVRINLHQRHGFRWKWPIHECLDGPPKTAPVDIVVEHRPDKSKSRGQYLDMLRAAHLADPTSTRMAWYYGRELWYRRKNDECRAQLEKFLAMPGGWYPERSEAYLILAALTPKDPEPYLWKSVAEGPQRREPFVKLARMHIARKEPQRARAMLLLAEARTDPGMFMRHSDAWDEAFDKLREKASTL